MDKILERLKTNLSEEDLKEFKVEFEKLVESRAVEYTAEREKILEKAAERMIAETVKKETAVIAENLEKEKKEELKEIEEVLTETVSQCIKEALKEAVTDDMLTKIALAEMYQPIIEGTQSLFETHLVKMSPSANKKIKFLEEKVTGLENKLDEAIEQNFEHERDKEALKRAILIESAKLDLNSAQAKELDLICEGVEYATLEKNMSKYITHIQEAATVNPRKYLSEQDEIARHQRDRAARIGTSSNPTIKSGKVMGDLDEAEQTVAPSAGQPSTQPRKKLIFRD